MPKTDTWTEEVDEGGRKRRKNQSSERRKGRIRRSIWAEIREKKGERDVRGEQRAIKKRDVERGRREDEEECKKGWLTMTETGGKKINDGRRG